MFVSGNQNLSQGSSEPFTIDRNELAGVLAGLGDGYFGTKERWLTVIFTYRTTDPGAPVKGKQRTQLMFKEDDTENLDFSSTALLGTYKLEDVTVIDTQHGKIRLGPASIPSHIAYDITVS